MAKLKLPLLSFAASGQIGKALVYFGWKGVNVVREHVIPSNPNTAGQQAQRTLFTTAVNDWHAIPWTAIDYTAWRTWAAVLAKPMSGFNAFIRTNINKAILGKDWTDMVDVLLTTPGAGQVDIELTAGGAVPTPVAYIGNSKTFFDESAAMTWGVSTWAHTFTGRASGVWQYLYAVSEDATHYGRVGVYAIMST